jgi:hypothetical protein
LFLALPCSGPRWRRRDPFEDVGRWDAALGGVTQVVDALCVPRDYIAQAISDVSTHPCISRASSFRRPFSGCLDRQTISVS